MSGPASKSRDKVFAVLPYSGNIPTDDLLYLLDRSGITSGVSLAKIIDVSRWLEEQLGRGVPAMLPKAGMFPGGNSQLA